MRSITGSELAAARTDPTSLARTLGVSQTRLRCWYKAGSTLRQGHARLREQPLRGVAWRVVSGVVPELFACPNAVATQAHLPRLIVLHDALVELSSVVSRQEWQDHYAEHLARLQELLANYANDAEVAEARSLVRDSDRETVDKLLCGRLDR